MVEIVHVAPRQAGSNIGDSSAVLIEDLVAKLLETPYVPLIAREADLEMADGAEFRWRGLLSRFVKPPDDQMSGQPLRRPADVLPLVRRSGDQFRTGQSIDPHVRSPTRPSCPGSQTVAIGKFRRDACDRPANTLSRNPTT